MPKKSSPLPITSAQRQTLETWIRAHNTPQSIAKKNGLNCICQNCGRSFLGDGVIERVIPKIWSGYVSTHQCPQCGSWQVVARVKTNDYLCRRCGESTPKDKMVNMREK